MDFLRTGKLTGFRKQVKYPAYFLAFFLFFFQTSAVASDYNFNVQNGSADLACQDSACTIQLTDGSILNWNNGLNIPLGESLNFLFNANNGSVLNNVFGSGTNILGSLFSNGNIFIISPTGINIGSAANINVGGLVASTLTMSAANFLSGNYVFENGSQAGNVVNAGHITAQPGGFVLLLGSSVENSGTITANLGSIVLASGEKMTVSFDPNGLINLAIDETLKQTISKSQDTILNNGLLQADGGKVLLTAKIAKGIFDYIINNTGIIEANSVAIRNGIVELVADGGAIQNAGTISANGTSENSNGGSVHVAGDEIDQFGTIRANAFDDGTAGHLNLVALYRLTLHTGSLTQARGTGILSNGGSAYLYSHRNANFEHGATIDLSGGVTGNAGSGEFSAADTLSISGDVIKNAADGFSTGTFLFDPLNLIFSGFTNCGGNCLYTADNNTTFDPGAQVNAPNGGLQFISDFDNDGNGTITMNSGSSVTARDYVYMDGAGSATFRDVTTTGSNAPIKIGTNTGTGRFQNFTNVTLDGSLTTAGGSVNVTANNDIAINQNIDAGAGDVTIRSYTGAITNGPAGLITGNTINLIGNSIGTSLSPITVTGNQVNTSLETFLLGDYNKNGVVDSADYPIWRGLDGSVGPNLAADGDMDGDVDNVDYQIWRAHFGNAAPALGGLFTLNFPKIPVVSVLGIGADLINSFLSPLFTQQETKRKVALFAY